MSRPSPKASAGGLSDRRLMVTESLHECVGGVSRFLTHAKKIHLGAFLLAGCVVVELMH